MKELSRRLDRIEKKMIIDFQSHSIEKRMDWALPMAREIRLKGDEACYNAMVAAGFISGPFCPGEQLDGVQWTAERLAKKYPSREAALKGEEIERKKWWEHSEPARKALNEAIEKSKENKNHAKIIR